MAAACEQARHRREEADAGATEVGEARGVSRGWRRGRRGRLRSRGSQRASSVWGPGNGRQREADAKAKNQPLSKRTTYKSKPEFIKLCTRFSPVLISQHTTSLQAGTRGKVLFCVTISSTVNGHACPTVCLLSGWWRSPCTSRGSASVASPRGRRHSCGAPHVHHTNGAPPTGGHPAGRGPRTAEATQPNSLAGRTPPLAGRGHLEPPLAAVDGCTSAPLARWGSGGGTRRRQRGSRNGAVQYVSTRSSILAGCRQSSSLPRRGRCAQCRGSAAAVASAVSCCSTQHWQVAVTVPLTPVRGGESRRDNDDNDSEPPRGAPLMCMDPACHPGLPLPLPDRSCRRPQRPTLSLPLAPRLPW